MKKLLTILLGLSLYSPIFAQTAPSKQDSTNIAEVYKTDSVVVDEFVYMLVNRALYQTIDTVHSIATRIQNDKHYAVYFYTDSIIVAVTNLKPNSISATELIMAGDYNLFGLTGGDIKFYRKPDHWYYFCLKFETEWFITACLPGIQNDLTSP
jgi:hypothetical protein